MTKIQNIVIDISGNEITLTLDQAKELQQLLNSTFGQKDEIKLVPYPAYVPQPYYPPYRYWDVTWTYTTNHTTANVPNNITAHYSLKS